MDRFRSFGNDFHLICILIFEVAKRRGDDNASFLLLPVTSGHTAAAISGIEVIHQTLEADDQIVCFVEGINVFCCGQHPHMVLTQVVDIQGRLGAVSSKSGQVFDDDCIDQSGIHRFRQLLNAVTIEVHTRNIIVAGLAHNRMPMAESIAFDNASLVHQGIEFFIFVTRQAVVKPYSHKFTPFRYGVCVRSTHHSI